MADRKKQDTIEKTEDNQNGEKKLEIPQNSMDFAAFFIEKVQENEKCVN